MLFERTIGTLDRGASETTGGRVGWGVDGGWLDIAISMKTKLSAFDLDFN